MSINNEEKDDFTSEEENEEIINNSEDDTNENEDEDSADTSNTTEEDSIEDSKVEDDKDDDKVVLTKEEYQALRIKNRIDKKETKKVSETSSEELTIARLEARGVLHPEDQSKVIKLAKILGVTPIEALQDADVQFALEKAKKVRNVNKATANTSRGGSSSTTKDVNWYIEKGVMPDNKQNPKLYEDVEKELIRRAQNSA